MGLPLLAWPKACTEVGHWETDLSFSSVSLHWLPVCFEGEKGGGSFSPALSSNSGSFTLMSKTSSSLYISPLPFSYAYVKKKNIYQQRANENSVLLLSSFTFFQSWTSTIYEGGMMYTCLEQSFPLCGHLCQIFYGTFKKGAPKCQRA